MLVSTCASLVANGCKGVRFFHFPIIRVLRRSMTSSSPSEPAPKRMCDVKTIGTHSGNFHCDEALACYMLKLLPEYEDARILRTRDAEKLKGCDIVVDVGGEYNPATHRYDHHQKSFTGTMSSLTDGKKTWTTKLSSAGLVYLHFGRRVISTITGIAQSEEELLEELFDRVYTNFVEEVDAVDNGIDAFDGTPRYLVTTSISYRVSRLKPSWNEPGPKDYDGQFQKAMELVGGEFTERIKMYKDVWLPARNIVHKAINSRLEVDKSGEIIVLEPPCPWKDHLYDLEKKLSLPESCIKFVLYKDTDSDQWRVQAVSVHSSSFQNRLSLPSDWCGLRDDELSQVSGIPGCIFAHASGFTGGNLTFDGALSMARKTLQMRTGTEQ